MTFRQLALLIALPAITGCSLLAPSDAELLGGGGRGGGGGVSGTGGAASASGGAAGALPTAGVTAGSAGAVAGPDQPVTAGLDLWLRADSGVTLTGGRVSRWAPKSGGSELMASDAATRPGFDGAGLGGRPLLSFDGADDALASAARAELCEAGVTIAFLFVPDATDAGTDRALLSIDDAAGNHLALRQRGTALAIGDRNDDVFVADVLPAAQPSLIVLTSGSGGVTVHRNGELKLKQSTALDLPGGADQQLTLGRTGSDGRASFAGRIGEVLVYGDVLGEAERFVVELYLQAGWGLSR